MCDVCKYAALEGETLLKLNTAVVIIVFFVRVNIKRTHFKLPIADKML